MSRSFKMDEPSAGMSCIEKEKRDVKYCTK